jgi:hypothetical protein
MSEVDVPEVPPAPSLAEDPRAISVEEVVRDMRITRVRYFMADTSAYIRYLPRFNPNPEDLSVNIDPFAEHHVEAEETGEFSIPELVNELSHAYVNIHLFPDREARNYFMAGFDESLKQVDFVAGRFEFSRLWVTAGMSNIGLPVAVFLGQRHAVNNQPSVSIHDHREHIRGGHVYRAVRGYGDHVGEEYLTSTEA